MMSDIRILQDQIEIGVPLESAALLAGYSFKEIEQLENDPKIVEMVALANANFISKHLLNISSKSEDNPRMSQWLLERLFPENFSQANKIIDKGNIPKSVLVRGVYPNDGENGT